MSDCENTRGGLAVEPCKTIYLSKPGKKYTYETDYYCMFDGVGGYWCGL